MYRQKIKQRSFVWTFDKTWLVAVMEFGIEKYLASKDNTRYGTGKFCGKKVYWTRQKVESHLRSGNCTESKRTTILPQELSHRKKEFSVAPFSRLMETNENLTEFKRK